MDFLMPPTETRKMDLHREGMTVFLAESREGSSKDGMSHGSLIDSESQRIKRTVFSTVVDGYIW